MSKNKTSLPKSVVERLVNGIFKENPTFVLLLGMCPTLAVTTSAQNGLGMGLTTMVVLAMSNLIISALRKVIPDKIRIPAFIVIIASFVTIVELLLEAYIPSLYDALGIYIPLIVVNCIILGRAEAYAYSHPMIPSLFDGIGMGLGFTLALTIIGGVREILGTGAVFGATIMPASYVPVNIFVMAPGAFFVLALLTAIQNKVKEIGEKRGHDMSKIQSGCGGNCMECNKECKVELSKPVETVKETAEDKTVTSDDKTEEKNSEETKKKETKPEETKPEETKPEETKQEEAKADKDEKSAKEETKTDEVKEEKPSKKLFGKKNKKAEVSEKSEKSENIEEKDNKKEELKPEETKAEETKAEVKPKEIVEKAETTDDGATASETNIPNEIAEDPADKEDVSESSKSETEEISEEKKSEEKAEPEKSDKPKKTEKPVEEDDDFEIIDLDDYKKAAEKKGGKSNKKHKKGNKNKALEMLSKAEETLKEDENND